MTKKKQYDYDKKIKELYHSDNSITEPYSHFKERMKRVKSNF